MALNYLFVGFFLIAFILCAVKALFLGEHEIFSDAIQSTFDMAKTGFELSLGLTGLMTLWLGLMKVGEDGGVIKVISRAINPLFSKLFPEVPKDHPAQGAIVMNVAMNMMGLDNAATPVGLKAMNQLQELNPKKDTASNAQIMFLVLNTSGLTIIPISIMLYRTQLGAANPTDVFLPILLATFFSTLAGIMAVSFVQKIKLYTQPVIWMYLIGSSLVIGSLIFGLNSLSQEKTGEISSFIGNFILFSIIIWFVSSAFFKKVNVYTSFIEGAKEGFTIAIKIIPYLVGILVAIGLFRTSGALDYLEMGFTWVFELFGANTDFTPSLSTAFMKPLSGSGARGMMLETLNHHGVDSFPGRVASVMQGSTETTFYVLAVYFGSVGVKNTRHAVGCGLFADLVGIIAAILLSYLFFY